MSTLHDDSIVKATVETPASCSNKQTSSAIPRMQNSIDTLKKTVGRRKADVVDPDSVEDDAERRRLRRLQRSRQVSAEWRERQKQQQQHLLQQLNSVRSDLEQMRELHKLAAPQQEQVLVLQQQMRGVLQQTERLRQENQALRVALAHAHDVIEVLDVSPATAMPVMIPAASMTALKSAVCNTQSSSLSQGSQLTRRMSDEVALGIPVLDQSLSSRSAAAAGSRDCRPAPLSKEALHYGRLVDASEMVSTAAPSELVRAAADGYHDHTSQVLPVTLMKSGYGLLQSSKGRSLVQQGSGAADFIPCTPAGTRTLINSVQPLALPWGMLPELSSSAAPISPSSAVGPAANAEKVPPAAGNLRPSGRLSSLALGPRVDPWTSMDSQGGNMVALSPLYNAAGMDLAFPYMADGHDRSMPSMPDEDTCLVDTGPANQGAAMQDWLQ